MSQTPPPDAGPPPAPPPSSEAPSPFEAQLPVEARSSSEILRATHVLLVEIRAVRATEWEVSPNEERRHLALDVALVQTLKGTTSRKDGDVFPFEVDQIKGSLRQPPPNVWSQLAPEVGSRFLFVSSGADDADPAVLLAPAAVVRVSSGDQAGDVALAKRAERIFVNVRDQPGTGGGDPEIAASRAILALTQDNIASAGDVFGRYLCARVLPSFARSPERPVAELASLLTSAKGTFGLKIEITAGLDSAGADLGGDAVFVRTVARAYFEMLLDPALAKMHHRLVQVSLYFLIFPEDEDTPKPRALDVVPDAATRGRYAKALEPHANERGNALAHWLAGP